MTLESSWFTDVDLPDNRQFYEAILGWSRDRKKGVGDYGVDENEEGSVGKVPGWYLTGEAQRNTTDILLSRKLPVCTYPLSPWLWSLPIL